MTRRLDGADRGDLFVDKRAFALADFAVAPGLRFAMAEAAQRIERFYSEGMPPPYTIATAPGVECARVGGPIGRVGVSVPAPREPLPPTVQQPYNPAGPAACPTGVSRLAPRPT